MNSSPAQTRSFSLTLGAAFLACASFLPAPASANPTAAIYEQKCASCHGPEGQGTPDGYEKPLFGDYTIDELADVIERTMPEGEPEACVGEEARQVAEYIYSEFYSLEARQRKGLASPPRIELSRLTTAQHRNAIADVLGHFTPEPRNDERPERRRRRRRRDNDDQNQEQNKEQEEEQKRIDERIAESYRLLAAGPQPGLRAQYFQSEGMNKANDLRDQRVDRRIDFNFEQAGPVAGIAPDQFAMIWEGSLIADETGYYEFRIRTQNGARLYVNYDPLEDRRGLRDDSAVAGQSALIDAWVGSGELRERSARIFLLGGRRYPIRLEFFKYLEPTASITLEWKPPQGTWAVLDHRNLTTAKAKRTFVVETPFPADDRSLGYERGTSISQEWHSAVASAALATSAEVVDRLSLLADLDDERQEEGDGDESDSPEESSEKKAARLEKIGDFLARFAKVAFRRPLTDTEQTFFREFPQSEPDDPKTAVRKAVVLILTSPFFLYTDLTPPSEQPDQYTIASRIALFLWDSIPDATLFEAAEQGQLATPEQIAAQATRMLEDPRTRAKVRGFFHQWLEIEGQRDLAKDEQLFPNFDEAIVADLRYSLETFLEQVFWSDSSDYRQLLLSDYLVLNDRLRELYQGDLPPRPDNGEGDSEFRPIYFPADQRAGVLTHPYLLSAFAYHNSSSPIHRGVFVTRNIVGRRLRPPPVAVAFKEDEFAPDLTMREKITQLTRDKACMSCHSVINPLGFALENYDAIGRWRTSEHEKPIDARAQYTNLRGETVDIDSARDIAAFAVESELARRTFVRQLFHHVVKQDPSVYGPKTLERLGAEFAADGYHMQRLIVRIAVLAALPELAPRPSSESVSNTSSE